MAPESRPPDSLPNRSEFSLHLQLIGRNLDWVIRRIGSFQSDDIAISVEMLEAVPLPGTIALTIGAVAQVALGLDHWLHQHHVAVGDVGDPPSSLRSL